MCQHPLLTAHSMAPGRLLTWWGMGKMVVRGFIYLGLAVVKRIYQEWKRD